MTTHDEVLKIIEKAKNEANSLKQGAQQVQQKVEGENIRPLPPQGVTPGRGASSVLPGMHQTSFGGSHIEFRGSTLAHGERRGSAVEFGHGTTVDITRLRLFSKTGHALPGSMPNFTQSILAKNLKENKGKK